MSQVRKHLGKIAKMPAINIGFFTEYQQVNYHLFMYVKATDAGVYIICPICMFYLKCIRLLDSVI